jgi:hypothetical protein
MVFSYLGLPYNSQTNFAIHMKLIWTIFLGYSSSHSFGRGLLLADPSTPRVAKQQCPASQFMILVTSLTMIPGCVGKLGLVNWASRNLRLMI